MIQGMDIYGNCFDILELSLCYCSLDDSSLLATMIALQGYGYLLKQTLVANVGIHQRYTRTPSMTFLFQSQLLGGLPHCYETVFVIPGTVRRPQFVYVPMQPTCKFAPWMYGAATSGVKLPYFGIYRHSTLFLFKTITYFFSTTQKATSYYEYMQPTL